MLPKSFSEKNSAFFETTAQSYHPAKLARQIFEAASPEEFAAALPAQALYMAIQHVGIESASDLINLATARQYRTMLDFELWQHDTFSEDNFWRWLEAIDESDSLEPTEKFLAALDYQLLSLLFSRYLEHFISEDGNDQPPGQHFYTPDKGFTWIKINIEEPLRHRLFGKLLAIIYETKSELFYQLLGIPLTTSPTALEETAYEERNLRLREFGIPSREEAWESQSVLNPGTFLASLAEDSQQHSIEIASGTTPIAVDTSNRLKIEKLRDQIFSLGLESNLETEISYLVNCSLIVSETSFADTEAIKENINFIRDTLNLALEYLELRSNKEAIDLYRSQGAVAIYRVGLWLLNDIKAKARTIQRAVNSEQVDEALQLVLNTLTQLHPYYPELLENGLDNVNPAQLIEPKIRPFSNVTEINSVKEFISAIQETMRLDQPKIES